MWVNKYRMRRKPTEWVTAYTGTVVPNVITCAVVNNRGRIIFDKSLEPRMSWDELHPTNDFNMAASFAFLNSKSFLGQEVFGEPVVIEGYLPAGPYLTCYMKRRMPIRRLWLPKDGTDLSDDYQHSKAYFDEIDPYDFIRRGTIGRAIGNLIDTMENFNK